MHPVASGNQPPFSLRMEGSNYKQDGIGFPILRQHPNVAYVTGV
jgi:hypothetical protein